MREVSVNVCNSSTWEAEIEDTTLTFVWVVVSSGPAWAISSKNKKKTVLKKPMGARRGQVTHTFSPTT